MAVRHFCGWGASGFEAHVDLTCTHPVPLNVLYSEQLADNPSKVIRIRDPLRRLAEAHVVSCAPLEALRGMADPAAALAGVDAVFLHLVDFNSQSAPWMAPLLAAALGAGVALICDTDDPYFFPADGVSFDADLAPHLDLMKRLCGSAHVVTVTTPTLKQELGSYARNIMVVPNMIDTDAWPQRAGNNARVRVGWCGGPTHADDLTLLLPAVAALQRQTDVEFVIFGMFDQNFDGTVQKARQMTSKARAQNPAVAAFGRMADALEGVTYQHVPSVPYDAFPARLAALNFDIGVCPLQDTRFNRCRSAVKFYQYVVSNTVTVASRVAAYQGECDLLADNTQAGWLAQLQMLVHDEQRREQALAEQKRYVNANRSWHVGLPLYTKLFTAVCAAVKHKAHT